MSDGFWNYTAGVGGKLQYNPTIHMKIIWYTNFIVDWPVFNSFSVAVKSTTFLLKIVGYQMSYQAMAMRCCHLTNGAVNQATKPIPLCILSFAVMRNSKHPVCVLYKLNCPSDIHLFSGLKKDEKNIFSWEIRYPPKKALLKMMFLFPRWDMLVPWSIYVTGWTVRFLIRKNKQTQMVGATPRVWAEYLTCFIPEGIRGDRWSLLSKKDFPFTVIPFMKDVLKQLQII